MGARTFADLEVWKIGHRVALAVYELTRSFPADERFGLTAQMRRAAASIPINITEGFSRFGQREKIRFYNISQTSGEELKYELILARDLRYCPEQCALNADLNAVCGGLCRLIRTIQATL
jgi:four helix bundle protein